MNTPQMIQHRDINIKLIKQVLIICVGNSVQKDHIPKFFQENFYGGKVDEKFLNLL